MKMISMPLIWVLLVLVAACSDRVEERVVASQARAKTEPPPAKRLQAEVEREPSRVTTLAAAATATAVAPLSSTAPPTVRFHTTDRFQIAGGTVTFASRGEAPGEVRYQWQFQGVDLPGATNSRLTLTNVQARNEGAYQVVVANEFGHVASPSALFRLVMPPAILSKSPAADPGVRYQAAVSLSVTASSLGQTNGFPLVYQWRHNGTNLAGPWSDTYTFPANAGSEGTYSVSVSNVAGSASAAWRVAIKYDTLARDLAMNAAARARGRTGTGDDKRLVNGWSYAFYTSTNLQLLTRATWSTNCWLSGAKGLPATPIGMSNNLAGQTMFTMVSPRHFLSASHVGVGFRGVMAAFLDTNNVVHWRRTVGEVVLGNDISVGILDADLPPSVGFLPVLSPGYTNYLPCSPTTVVQGVGMNQDLQVFSQPITFQNLADVRWSPLAAAPFGLGTNWNVGIRGGDSSLPVRLLVKDQLVLVTQHHFADSGPNLTLAFGAINQAMHSLSASLGLKSDFQLTPYDFSDWPALR
jgi:hypothetical protein